MKKVLFIDRDGTLIVDPPPTYQIDSFEKLEFIPGVFRYLSQIAEELEYELVMVSNQDGLGTASFPEETFWPVHNLILKTLASEGVRFSEVLIDKSFAEEKLPTRKPGTGLISHYLKGHYNLAESFVIGDRQTDIELAKNAGTKAIFIGKENNPEAALTATHWKQIYEFLKGQPRTAAVERNTNETKIQVKLNLDGSGKSSVKTGLGFFDHMLEQIARHGQLDVQVSVNGDLHIDEHHTIEDTGLALGTAFREALGLKKGVARYGFLLPMDDCLAQVAIDFGGRPWLVWEAEFKREKVGEMPTEMFFHFFKSFSDEARCNLNIKAEGDNEHHKIESIFKAFARAVKMAVAKTGDSSIPSTKGSL